MTYQYAYRDSSNVRHDGTVVASSKDDAFKKLKAQGIKPFFVAPAPGLLNGILGLGKRGLAIIVLCAVCLVLCAVMIHTRRSIQSTPQMLSVPDLELASAINSQTRRQPIGDVAVIDRGIRTGWADVFKLEGERFLAGFAVPGTPVAVRSTTEAEVKKALSHRCSPSPTTFTSIEARQIASMVEGMKAELRKYLADGGSIAEYGQELVRRQDAEIAQRQRAQTSLEEDISSGKSEAEISASLEALNRQLRRMGIKPLTMPEKDEVR